MNKNYPVILYPVEENSNTAYSVLIPDFPGCVSSGNSYQEALGNARAALELHIQAMIVAGEVLPEPSTVDQIQDKTEPAAVYGLVEVPLAEVRDKALARKSVRINVTFPGELLHKIDDYCEKAGLARSKFFHLLAEQFLHNWEHTEHAKFAETTLQAARNEEEIEAIRSSFKSAAGAFFSRYSSLVPNALYPRASPGDLVVFWEQFLYAAFGVYEKLKKESEKTPAVGAER